MRRVKKKEDARVRRGKSRVVSHRDFGLKFSYIAGEFRPESYYAECVDLLRKLMLTGVLGLIHAGTVLQSFCSVVMSMFFLGLHIAMWVSGTLLKLRSPFHLTLSCCWRSHILTKEPTG